MSRDDASMGSPHARGLELQGQLVNFLKNVAMFGGLCCITFRAAPDAHPRAVTEHRKEVA